jgi:hypothetical protein
MKMKPIDLIAIEERNNEILKLFKLKVDLFKQKPYVNKDNNLFKLLDHLNNQIEIRILQFCVMQNTTFPNIPKNDNILDYIWGGKLNVINAILTNSNITLTPLKRVELKKEMYFNSQSIKQGFPVNAAGNDPNYIKLLREEMKALTSYRDEDEYEYTCHKIKLFYTVDAIKTRTMKPKIKMTKAESDAKIDERVRRYKEIISLLERKRELLKEKNVIDELERIDIDIEIVKLDVQIESKKDFLERWSDRKEILP